MKECSDEELLKMYREGDNPSYAFNLIVRKHQEKIYYFVRRMVVNHDDADDVVQNVFIKTWKNLDSFREDSKLYTWIYRIAVNESISFLRARRLRALLHFSSLENELVQSLTEDPTFDADALQVNIQKAILSLPDKQRAVFSLRYYDEMSYEKMSEILGTSVGALKASYHIASKKIAEFVISD